METERRTSRSVVIMSRTRKDIPNMLDENNESERRNRDEAKAIDAAIESAESRLQELFDEIPDARGERFHSRLLLFQRMALKFMEFRRDTRSPVPPELLARLGNLLAEMAKALAHAANELPKRPARPESRNDLVHDRWTTEPAPQRRTTGQSRGCGVRPAARSSAYRQAA